MASETQVFILSNTYLELLFNILSKLKKLLLKSCQFDHLIPTSGIKVLNLTQFSTSNANVTSHQTLQKKVDMKNVNSRMYTSVCSRLNSLSWVSVISFRRITLLPAEQSVFKVNSVHAENIVQIKLETPHTDSATNDLALLIQAVDRL